MWMDPTYLPIPPIPPIPPTPPASPFCGHPGAPAYCFGVCPVSSTRTSRGRRSRSSRLSSGSGGNSPAGPSAPTSGRDSPTADTDKTRVPVTRRHTQTPDDPWGVPTRSPNRRVPWYEQPAAHRPQPAPQPTAQPTSRPPPHYKTAGPTARPKRVDISGRNSLDLQEGSVAAPGSLQQPGSVRPGPETDKPGSVQAASEAAVTSPVPADKGGTDDHGAVPQQPSSTVKGGPAAKLSSRQRRPSRPDLAPDAPSNGENRAGRSVSNC